MIVNKYMTTDQPIRNQKNTAATYLSLRSGAANN